MKSKPDFRDTPIGEVFEQTKHDLALIQRDVENKHFEDAVQGLDFQIEALTKLRNNMKLALTGA